MSGTTLALVLGDSHVCWLEHFVSSSGVRFETGSSFNGTDCHFKFAGFRGGYVSSLCDDSVVDRLLELQMPSIVVLCLGGNDVYGTQEPVLTVGMHLYEYAQSLIARGVSHVVVCQTKARGLPAQTTGPSSTDPARRLATAAATSPCQRSRPPR
ncbi:hypothetical protein NP493_1056g01004 [Ridgeia piscesae]|uniref:SGNH hydrolase-type esterase domain-containing protein n=1 Tax=Ridgeia piscesae TaxID=27915 RepID=A0AAD9NLG9_RIDPI|nr:hypothetical protein NP493_1056g01004 [Ridgeia piscesae]